jgi:hypothetical protein
MLYEVMSDWVVDFVVTHKQVPETTKLFISSVFYCKVFPSHRCLSDTCNKENINRCTSRAFQ